MLIDRDIAARDVYTVLKLYYWKTVSPSLEHKVISYILTFDYTRRREETKRERERE